MRTLLRRLGATLLLSFVALPQTSQAQDSTVHRTRPARPLAQGLPNPEFHGIYAVVGNRLLGLDGPPGDAVLPKMEVRIGKHVNVNVANGNPIAVSDSAIQVPVLPADLQFIVFVQTSGPLSSMTVAQALKVQPVPFVRRLYVNMGFPSNARANAPVNAWDVSTSSSLSVGNTTEFETIALYTKPHPARPEAVVGVPSRKLSPGLYRLFAGEELPGFKPPGILFAVGSRVEAEVAKCIDLTDEWTMLAQRHSGITCRDAGPDVVTDAPAAPVTAEICPDFDQCYRAGLDHYQAGRWAEAITYLEVGVGYDTRNTTGRSLLARAQLRSQLWDAALENFLIVISMGDPVSFLVCHERGVLQDCDVSTLSISRTTVTLNSQGGSQKFSAPPGSVGVGGVKHLGDVVSLRITVDGKNYDLDPVPAGTPCNRSLYLTCPGAGDQVVALSNMIGQSLRAAAAPQVGGACAGAQTAPYQIAVAGTTYQVRRMNSSGRLDGYVFVDAAENVVTDHSLIERLTVAAMTVERVIQMREIDLALQRVEVVRQTSAALDRYTVAQDVLVNASIEAIKAVATEGASLTAAIPNLTWAVVTHQLANPEALLARLSRAALSDAAGTLRQAQQVNGLLSSPYDADKVREVWNQYVRARSLELPYGSLASALLPTSGRQLFDKAFSSAAQGALAGLPANNEVITIKQLLDLHDRLAASIAVDAVFKSYAENLALARRLAESERNELARFVGYSESTCR